VDKLPKKLRVYTKRFNHLMDEGVVLTDPVQYSTELVRLLKSARHRVYYSSFTAHLDVPLPGQQGVTLGDLFNELGWRGVELNILYNPEEAYGNLSPAAFAARLAHATVHAVYGSGTLPPWASVVVNNLRYSNHHQKYVCVDEREFMLGGTDVTADRAGWLQLNSDGYVWHEVAVVVGCTPQMAYFVKQNFEAIITNPPFPLTKGLQEYLVIARLIETARTCIHMEAQTCISSGATYNRLLDLVVQRVHRAHTTPGDEFRFMLLTNTVQADESAVISWVTRQQLHWSRRFLRKRAAQLGLPPDVLTQRVFIGYMAHGEKHIKVHSNLIIQDGKCMVRSSSNFNDRSWSMYPSDNELGVALCGDVVARAQQRLWRQYFRVPPHVQLLVTPTQAFDMMCAETGVVRKVTFHAGGADSTVLPDAVADVGMRLLHTGPWWGGRQKVEWEVRKVLLPSE
jgi:phosphatidylserine/phosphatidylglycerophosphate/cardiolipin synthase-like enzyme